MAGLYHPQRWGGERGGSTVGSQQGIEKQEEITSFDVQCWGCVWGVGVGDKQGMSCLGLVATTLGYLQPNL